MRIAPTITLSPEQRMMLESQARSRSLPVRVAERARIVLLAASGQQDKDIAAALFLTPKKVSRWRKRFLALGRRGLAHRSERSLKSNWNSPLQSSDLPAYRTSAIAPLTFRAGESAHMLSMCLVKWRHASKATSLTTMPCIAAVIWGPTFCLVRWQSAPRPASHPTRTSNLWPPCLRVSWFSRLGIEPASIPEF
jgi:hypothetical protein